MIAHTKSQPVGLISIHLDNARRFEIVYAMVKYQPVPADAVFLALADPTRRAIIARLSTGKASISELAEPHQMSLAAVLKHVNMLADSGIVLRSKTGRVVTCELQPKALEEARAWLDRHLAFWSLRLDALEQLLQAPAKPEPGKSAGKR